MADSGCCDLIPDGAPAPYLSLPVPFLQIAAAADDRARRSRGGLRWCEVPVFSTVSSARRQAYSGGRRFRMRLTKTGAET
jgi:hypothetical protein